MDKYYVKVIGHPIKYYWLAEFLYCRSTGSVGECGSEVFTAFPELPPFVASIPRVVWYHLFVGGEARDRGRIGLPLSILQVRLYWPGLGGVMCSFSQCAGTIVLFLDHV